MPSSRASPTGIANTVAAVIAPRSVGHTTLGHERFVLAIILWAFCLRSGEALIDMQIQADQREDDANRRRIDGWCALRHTSVHDVLEYEVLATHGVDVELVVGVHESEV